MDISLTAGEPEPPLPTDFVADFTSLKPVEKTQQMDKNRGGRPRLTPEMAALRNPTHGRKKPKPTDFAAQTAARIEAERVAELHDSYGWARYEQLAAEPAVPFVRTYCPCKQPDCIWQPKPARPRAKLTA